MRNRGGAHALTSLVGEPQLEDEVARAGGPVLVCDGDAFAAAASLVVEVDARPVDEQVAGALAAVDELLARGWDLADPVTPG